MANEIVYSDDSDDCAIISPESRKLAKEIMEQMEDATSGKVKKPSMAMMLNVFKHVLSSKATSANLACSLIQKLNSANADEVLSTYKHIIMPMLPKELLLKEFMDEQTTNTAELLRKSLAEMDGRTLGIPSSEELSTTEAPDNDDNKTDDADF